MNQSRPLPSNFQMLLQQKDAALIDLYLKVRQTILKRYPKSNELLYYTHALTSVFTVSEKMSDGFCLIPIYKAHLNLGFQRGVLLADTHRLLSGTGKLMRHIPIRSVADLQKEGVTALLDEAYELAREDAGAQVALKGITISKLK